MNIITQQTVRNHAIYRLITVDDAGRITNEERYDCRVAFQRENGVVNAYLYDKDGHLRQDACIFLNDYVGTCSEATKRQAAAALNNFLTYCDITATDVTNLCAQDIRNWQQFARGATLQGHLGGPVTFRSAETVNIYYHYVKSYVHYHITDAWNFAAFSNTITKQYETTVQDISLTMRRKIDTNRLRTDPQKSTEPKFHLTPREAADFLRVISESGNHTALMLATLQLTTGIRMGAALGLTTQDITTSKDEHGQTIYKLILRNRCSDRRDQSCKGLYHPVRTDEYAGKTYHSYKTWEIRMTGDLHDALLGYLSDSRDAEKHSREYMRRLREAARADNVFPEQDKSNVEYIFVGKSGRPLTAQTWNAWLKGYFTAIGIPVDTGKKSTNCSHRLRHTYAMMGTTYTDHPYTPNQMKVLLTHASVMSGIAYYTPTDEERAKLQTGLQEQIFQSLNEHLKNK